MYQELKGNENFSDKYATWVIAYCLDTDSFFATNQRHFFWEYNDEFQCENDAVNYFRNHLDEFRNVLFVIIQQKLSRIMIQKFFTALTKIVKVNYLANLHMRLVKTHSTLMGFQNLQ